MGNSEVGHLNLGAGRVVYQDLLLIKRMVESGELDAHARLNAFLRACSRGSSVLHMIGLFSDGGVHSHIDHLRGLIDIARRRGVRRIWIHALLDGRDTAPRHAEQYFRLVAERMHAGVGFASLGGRYFGMDRDRRWVRTMQAWEAIVHGDGPRAADWEAGMRDARERKEGDEFVTPTVLGDYAGHTRRGLRAVLQLPRRPHAAARQRVPLRRLRRLRPRARADDAHLQRAALPRRLRQRSAARRGRRAGDDHRAARAGAGCASTRARRRRSTRT